VTISETRTCRRCGKPFKPRQTGGKLQRFCDVLCRRTFDAAVRARGRAEIEAERATVAVGNRACATRALVQQHETRPPILSRGIDDPTHSDGSTRFVVEIPRSLIKALIFTHRYLRFDQRDDLREILAALDRAGRRPSITRLG
jgi:hypothetical protein